VIFIAIIASSFNRDFSRPALMQSNLAFVIIMFLACSTALSYLGVSGARSLILRPACLAIL
jgi:hypothetical protein